MRLTIPKLIIALFILCFNFGQAQVLEPVTWSNFSAAFDYPSVLEGGLDFVYYWTSYPWDHLAGSLMLAEVGGVSRTLDGVAYSALTKPAALLMAADVGAWIAAQSAWPTDRN